MLIAAGVAGLAALAVLPFVGTSPIPSFKDEDVLVRLEAPPGTSNPRMTQIATQVTRELRSLPGVENVAATVGRAVGGDQRVDVNSGEVWVSLAADADHDATVASIENVLAQTQDAEQRGRLFGSEDQRRRGTQKGTNTATGEGLDVLTGPADHLLVVRVYGQNLDDLRTEAAKVRTLMTEVDGVVDPVVRQPTEQPNVEIEVDIAKAREADQARRRAPRGGHARPGPPRRQRLRGPEGLPGDRAGPETHETVSDVENLLIDTAGGNHVRLGEVADVRITDGPIAIDREAVSRFLDVEANERAQRRRRGGRHRGSSPELRVPARVPRGGARQHGIRRRDRLGDCARGRARCLPALAGGLLELRLALLGVPDAPGRPRRRGAGRGDQRRRASLGALVGLLALLGLAARNGLLRSATSRTSSVTRARSSAANSSSAGRRNASDRP